MARRLAPREYGVLTDAFVDLEEHLAIARDATDRARHGATDGAYLELDMAASRVDELADLARRLSPLLVKLSGHTQRQTTTHSRPPTLKPAPPAADVA
jgi:hypothetical protein